jgi:hypothetical protein
MTAKKLSHFLEIITVNIGPLQCVSDRVLGLVSLHSRHINIHADMEFTEKYWLDTNTLRETGVSKFGQSISSPNTSFQDLSV